MYDILCSGDCKFGESLGGKTEIGGKYFVLMLLCFKIIKSSFLIIKGEVEGLCGQRPGRDGTNGEGDQGGIRGN